MGSGRVRRAVLAAGLGAAALAGVGPEQSSADPVCPDSDSNNSLSAAEPLAGSVVDRSLCGPEHDWFSLPVERGELISVDVYFEAGAGEIDMTLRDPDGTELVAGEMSGAVESIRHEALADGLVFVDVFEREGDDDSEYSLFASVGPAGPCGEDEDALEPNDVRAAASPLGSDGPVELWLCAAPDVFEVHVPEGSPDPLSVSINLASSAGDLDLALYDEAGDLKDSSTGTGAAEEVGIGSVVPAGAYYVEVYGHEGASGGYTLEVEGASSASVVEGEVRAWDPSELAEVAAPGVVVRAHPSSEQGAVAVAGTEASGDFGFDFGQLSAGTYRFEFVDPAGTSGAWATEWFDRASAHATATDVEVDGAPTELNPVLLQLVIEANPFTGDVPSGYWAVDAIRYLWTYRIAEGTDATHFDPIGEITRAQLVRMLYRAAGSPAVCDPNYSEPFGDIPSTHWARDAITWASCDPVGQEEPIATGVNGPSGLVFEPGESITRAQTARMVHRFAGAISTDGLSEPFTDIGSGFWALDAVKWVSWDPDGPGQLEPLMSGFADGTFRPQDALNRAQGANLLWRLAQSESHWDTSDGSAFWQDAALVPGSVLFR